MPDDNDGVTQYFCDSIIKTFPFTHDKLRVIFVYVSDKLYVIKQDG